MEHGKEFVKNLVTIGLIGIAMVGLNYIGYKFGINTDVLAAHAALSLAGTTIAVNEAVGKVKKRKFDK